MPITALRERSVSIDDEGFMTQYNEWDEAVAKELAERVGISLTDAHWVPLHFLRKDFADRGETPTLRRVSTGCGVSIKALFALFPQKPAKKMAYIAGLPKPRGCV